MTLIVSPMRLMIYGIVFLTQVILSLWTTTSFDPFRKLLCIAICLDIGGYKILLSWIGAFTSDEDFDGIEVNYLKK